jgi:hypothetical protein
VKQLKQDNLGVADLEISGKLISDGQTKSEILNKQLSSVFTHENLANIPAVGDNPKPAIRPINISISGVTKQLLSLKTNKAS